MTRSLFLLSLLLALTLSLKLATHNHEGTVSEALTAQDGKNQHEPTSPTLPVPAKKVELVTNPLAFNIVVNDRQKAAEEIKQRLDNHDIDYEACPIETPFWNGKSCIKCQNYFNVNFKACVTCPQNTVYNKDTFRCENVVYLTNLDGEGLLVGDRKIDDWKSFQQRIVKINPVAIVRCPLDKPHLIDDKCGKCEGENNLYDLTSGKCEKCGDNESYDKDDRKCLSKKLITGLNDIIASITPVPVAVPVQPAPATVTVSTTPTSENKTTTTTTTTETITPPTPVLVTPIATVSSDHGARPAFLTNPTTYGLILDNESLDQFTARYNYWKGEGVEDCPNAKGYFDGTSCIGCPGVDSKFQQSTRKCTKCPKGTYYKFALRNCVPDSSS